MEERFRALQDIVRLSIGGGEAVVYEPVDRQAVLLRSEELAMLARCGQFATLHEHAARLAGPTVSTTTSLSDRVAALHALADKGALVSERQIAARIGAVALDEPAPPPIRSFGVPSGGRRALALGAVESFARASAPERELDITVAHDAADAGEAAELERDLAAMSAAGRLGPGVRRMRYAGPEERAAYARALAERAQVDGELTAWALTRHHPALWSAGMSRNALLLEGVGELALQFDDDVRSEVCTPPEVEPGLAFTSQGSMMELWFPAPGAQAESLARLEAADVAALHEEMLGRRVAACLGGADDIDVGDASGAFLREIIAGRGRVAATQLGLIGDSATGSLGHYFLLRELSRERLLASEAVYQHAFASRQGMRSTRRRAVSEGPYCMSYALGLDERELLPPFMPVGRNADGIFGFVLRQCCRDAYFGLLPAAIAHRPPARPYSVDKLISEARRIDANDLVCRIVAASGIQWRSGEPESAFDALGRYLESVAALALADLEELVRTAVLRTRSRDIAMLRGTLEAHQRRPAFWAHDVERLIAAMNEAVLEPEHSQPRDLVAAFGPDAGRRALAEQIGRYGRLIAAWPTLFRAALELKREGVRPSRPVPS